MRKIFSLMCILIPSMALADGYWERIITMAQKHPSFEAMRSVELSAQSLGDIEKARRFPVVSGTLSRVDGSSTLTQTSDAIQAGIAVTYPLFDNDEQVARDAIATAQGRLEYAESVASFDAATASIANAYIDLWRAYQIKSLFEQSLLSVNELMERVEAALVEGEGSFTDQAFLMEHKMALSASLLDVKLEIAQAKEVWPSADLEKTVWLLPDMKELGYVLGDNSALAQTKEELALKQAELKLARSEDGLSIDLNAALLKRQFSEGDDATDFTWALAATYPLFDGGFIDSKIKRQSFLVKSKVKELDLIEYQQRQALTNQAFFIESKNSYINEKAAHCDRLNDLLAKTKERYALGKGQVKEVLDVDLKANECHADVLTAHSDVYKAFNAVSRLNGTFGYFAGLAR